MCSTAFFDFTREASRENFSVHERQQGASAARATPTAGAAVVLPVSLRAALPRTPHPHDRRRHGVVGLHRFASRRRAARARRDGARTGARGFARPTALDPRIERSVVDLLDDRSVREAEAWEGATHVFHLAGVTKRRTLAQFRYGNVVPTANLLAAAVARGGSAPPRVVLVSSQAAAGPAPALERPVREDDPPRPIEGYGQSKLEAEQAVRLHEGRTSHCRGFGPLAVRPPCGLGEHTASILEETLGTPARAGSSGTRRCRRHQNGVDERRRGESVKKFRTLLYVPATSPIGCRRPYAVVRMASCSTSRTRCRSPKRMAGAANLRRGDSLASRDADVRADSIPGAVGASSRTCLEYRRPAGGLHAAEGLCARRRRLGCAHEPRSRSTGSGGG